MTVQDRLNNYELPTLSLDEQKAHLSTEFQSLLFNTIMNRDSIYSITAHTSVLEVVKQVIYDLQIPADYTDPYGATWDEINDEFVKFCQSLEVTELKTETLEQVSEDVLDRIPDNQLFIQVMRGSDKLAADIDNFLTSLGAKAKVRRAGLPFEPTIAEKRMLALMTALFAPEEDVKGTEVLV